jgi:phosphoenolpyruvate synthase/pyruvate phosphate dikinase
VIPKYVVERIIQNTVSLEIIQEEITRSLSYESYAVRSAAFIEDSTTSSFAGQFKTLVDI